VSTVRLPLVKIDMSSALSAPNLSAKQFDCGQRAGSAGRGCLLAENRVLYLLTRAAVGVVPAGCRDCRAGLLGREVALTTVGSPQLP
jgi:hypothetical protein